MKPSSKVVVLLLVACAIHLDLQIQRSGRLQVGVALGRGWPLGLANIGAIPYFEEHRIPLPAKAGAEPFRRVSAPHTRNHCCPIGQLSSRPFDK
jgi:hypothetical protein